MSYLKTGLDNGARASSPTNQSSSASSYGLAWLNLPEPKYPHPEEWTLPREHKIEKREDYKDWKVDVQSQIRNISAKLKHSIEVFSHQPVVSDQKRPQRDLRENRDLILSSQSRQSAAYQRPR